MSHEDRQTILYIEDDPASRILVQRALGFAGYHVLVAPNGLTGIDLARESRPALILMDINLPDLSGREVTTRLRGMKGFDSLPIVALTAQSHAGEHEKAIAAGLTGYLTKPVDIDALPGHVKEYLEGKRDEVDAVTLAQAHTAYSQEVVGRLENKIRELELAYNNLKRLDKMKESFIQLTAHELRTPLTLIYGYGRLITNSPVMSALMTENEDAAHLINMLLQGIDRMSEVINEILLISRVTTGRIELALNVVTIKDILMQIVQEHRDDITQRNMNVKLNTAGAPEKIYADRDLLRLAIDSLIANAIKYTPDGGTIRVRASKHNDRLLIIVQDTGIGINKEDQKMIFESFYSAGNPQLHSSSKVAFQGGGLGLGLALCKEIIKAHGGKVWVDSPGKDEEKLPGSTFIIAMPMDNPRLTSSPMWREAK